MTWQKPVAVEGDEMTHALLYDERVTRRLSQCGRPVTMDRPAGDPCGACFPEHAHPLHDVFDQCRRMDDRYNTTFRVTP